MRHTLARHARTAGISGLAVFTGTVLAVTSAGPAAADPDGTTRLLTSALAEGSAIQLQGNAPASLGPLGDHTGITLAHARGTHTYDEACAKRPSKATSLAELAAGTGITEKAGGQRPLAALNRSASANLKDPGPDANTDFEIPPNPYIAGGVASVRASVEPATGNTGAGTTAVNLRVGPLAKNLPGGAVSRLTASVDQAGQRLTGVLDSSLPQLDSVLGPIIDQQPSSTAGEAAKRLQLDLELLLAELPAAVEDIESQPLLDVKELYSSQHIQRTSQHVQAQATAGVGDVSLLGGLVTVEAFESRANATAGGRPGQAKANADAQTLNVTVATVLTLTVDEGGLHLPGVDALPGDVRGQLQPALDTIRGQLSALLSRAGLVIEPSAQREKIGEDGNSAIAETAGLLVSFTPPSFSEPAFALTLGRAVASVAAKQGSCTAAPPAHGSDKKLARTGPAMPYTPVGVGLLGAAGILGALWMVRRRPAKD